MSHQHFQQLFDLARQIHTPKEQIILAACACARTALQYIPRGEVVAGSSDLRSDRPRIAIETIEKWCRGEATFNELKQARGNIWQCWKIVPRAAPYAIDAAFAVIRATYSAILDANVVDDAAACAAHAASAHATSKNEYGNREYQQVYQQAEQEMCQLILQHIPRLKNLMVMT